MARRPRIVLAGHGPVNRRQTLTIVEKVIKKHEDGLDFLVPVSSLTDSHIPPVAEVIGSYLMSLDQTDVNMIFVTPASEEVPDEGFVSDLRDRAAIASLPEDADGDLPVVALNFANAAKGDMLAVVWEDEDPSLARTVAAAASRDLPVRDLTNGFALLTLDLDGQETTAKPEPEPEPVAEPEPEDELADVLATPELIDAIERFAYELAKVVTAASKR